MIDEQQATEERIFEAARDVFYESGFSGARTKEIARRAGINHSMLHYYYRTKDLLFAAVFRRAALRLIPPVLKTLQADLPLLEKLEAFVDGYLSMIRANPHLPAFILQELRRNPDALREIAGDATRGVFEQFSSQVDEAVSTGLIRPVDPRHLLSNVLALCVFPFVARPMLQVALGASNDDYEAFLDERKETIREFIRNALIP